MNINGSNETLESKSIKIILLEYDVDGLLEMEYAVFDESDDYIFGLNMIPEGFKDANNIKYNYREANPELIEHAEVHVLDMLISDFWECSVTLLITGKLENQVKEYEHMLAKWKSLDHLTHNNYEFKIVNESELASLISKID